MPEKDWDYISTQKSIVAAFPALQSKLKMSSVLEKRTEQREGNRLSHLVGFVLHCLVTRCDI